MLDDTLIPSPPLVRERLAQNLEEARMLRRLLRLAERHTEHRHRIRAAAVASPPVPDVVPRPPEARRHDGAGR
jgi:hypothetical protein